MKNINHILHLLSIHECFQYICKLQSEHFLNRFQFKLLFCFECDNIMKLTKQVSRKSNFLIMKMLTMDNEIGKSKSIPV